MNVLELLILSTVRFEVLLLLVNLIYKEDSRGVNQPCKRSKHLN